MHEGMTAAVPAAQNRTLIGPVWDFMFAGGFWVILATLIYLFIPHQWRGAPVGPAIASAVLVLPFLTTYAHFAASYQLMYGNFIERVTAVGVSPANRARLWVSGVAVPLILFFYLVTAFAYDSVDMLRPAYMAMTFFLGWHHTKQGYGVLVVLSAKQGISFTGAERTVLRTNAYAAWLMAWGYLHTLPNVGHLFGPYETLGFPAVWGGPMLAALALAALPAGAVLLRKSLRYRRAPCWAGVVGYVAPLYLWVLLLNIHPLFMFFVHYFHALQYMPFVGRMQFNKYRERMGARAAWLRLAGFGAVAVLLGYIFMGFVPHFLQRKLESGLSDDGFDIMQSVPAMMLFVIFFNIHHFFIDSAIWRHDNPELRKYL
ncbi:MAG: hypothetical protein GC131_02330 [Alphaproteobacteria bacterium]|nr:hypothetical protein [Alphaproteobacteria bacterium]